MEELKTIFLTQINLQAEPSTALRNRQRLDHFTNYFKGKHPKDITVDDVIKWQAWLVNEAQINGHRPRSMAIRFMNWLVDTDVLAKSPFRKSLMPTLPAKHEERIPVAPAQFERLLEVLRARDCYRTYLETAVMVAWYTGMRLGDVCMLTWEQVDFENEEIKFVQRKTKRKDGKVKTIAIDPDLYGHLLECYNTKPEGSKYVCRELAGIYQVGCVKAVQLFRGPFDKAGMPKQSFHCLRHGLATRLASAGVSIAVIRSITGQSLEVVQKYIHPTSDDQRRAFFQSKQHQQLLPVVPVRKEIIK